MLLREGNQMSKFKPDDWIKITYSNFYNIKPYITKYTGYQQTNHNFIISVELWQPKVGEWVVVADDVTPDLYVVFQFNNHSTDRQILPLVFLQSLRDNS
jgi:hypothetical protein